MITVICTVFLLRSIFPFRFHNIETAATKHTKPRSRATQKTMENKNLLAQTRTHHKIIFYSHHNIYDEALRMRMRKCNILLIHKREHIHAERRPRLPHKHLCERTNVKL